LRMAASRAARAMDGSDMLKAVEEVYTSRKQIVRKSPRENIYTPMSAFPLQSAPMDTALHKQEVGERLRATREALGYSQSAFGRLHGVDRGRLNHWEQGRHYPDPAFVHTLWQQHRVTADWIYLGVFAGLPQSLGGVNLRVEARAKSEAA
jgi:DNA-binding XRE family transcriptional regulator